MWHKGNSIDRIDIEYIHLCSLMCFECYFRCKLSNKGPLFKNLHVKEDERM